MTDLVFDTSAVINGEMIKLAKSGAIKDSQVIILTAVMNQRQCNFYSNAEKDGHLERSGKPTMGLKTSFSLQCQPSLTVLKSATR